MEIVLTALVAAAVAVGVVLLAQRPRALATLSAAATARGAHGAARAGRGRAAPR